MDLYDAIFYRPELTEQAYRLAKAFGVNQLSRDILNTSNLRNGGHIVAYSNSDLRSHAQIYASWTNRDVVQLETYEQISQNQNIDIVVLSKNDIALQFLELVSNPSMLGERTSLPGVLFVYEDEQYPWDIIRPALSLFLSLQQNEFRRQSIYPLMEIQYENEDILSRVLDKKTRKPEVEACLKGPTALLSLTTHSDGIDANLGDKAVFCGWKSWRTSDQQAKAPRCVEYKYCHRMSMNFDDSNLEQCIVEPKSVSSQVFLLDTCYGFQVSEKFNARSYSIAEEVLKKGAVGAFITNIDMALTNFVMTESILDRIVEEKDLGSGLHSFLVSKMAFQNGRRLVLFGDPLQQLISTASVVEKNLSDHTIDLESKVKKLNGLDIGMLAFISAKKNDPSINFIDWCLSRGKLFDLWASKYGILYKGNGGNCPNCLSLMRVFGSRSAQEEFSREFHLCTECGIVADRPKSCGVVLSRTGQNEFMLEIDGNFPNKIVSAVLQMWTGGRDDALSYVWPFEHGTLSKFYKFDGTWPKGAIRISVFVFTENDYAVASIFERE